MNTGRFVSSVEIRVHHTHGMCVCFVCVLISQVKWEVRSWRRERRPISGSIFTNARCLTYSTGSPRVVLRTHKMDTDVLYAEVAMWNCQEENSNIQERTWIQAQPAQQHDKERDLPAPDQRGLRYHATKYKYFIYRTDKSQNH